MKKMICVLSLFMNFVPKVIILIVHLIIPKKLIVKSNTLNVKLPNRHKVFLHQFESSSVFIVKTEPN